MDIGCTLERLPLYTAWLVVVQLTTSHAGCLKRQLKQPRHFVGNPSQPCVQLLVPSMAPPQQAVTDLVVLLDNPPDIIARREELFHLHNGTIRLTPDEFDKYWPYMTNAYVYFAYRCSFFGSPNSSTTPYTAPRCYPPSL